MSQGSAHFARSLQFASERGGPAFDLGHVFPRPDQVARSRQTMLESVHPRSGFALVGLRACRSPGIGLIRQKSRW